MSQKRPYKQYSREYKEEAVALVPKPRVNLTRFHGVFAPNSKRRVQVTQSKCVFNIDIEVCENCGGGQQAKVIASIEDPKVIELILKHLKQKAAEADASKHMSCHQSGPSSDSELVRPISESSI